jgi:HSP20 family protein
MKVEKWRPTRGPFRRGGSAELERHVDEFFGRIFRGWSGRRLEADAAGWMPPMDMIDRKNEIVLQVDLPGLDHEDVEVTVKDGMLMVQGTRHHVTEEKGDDHYAQERWSGSFLRSVALPQGIKEEEIDASFDKGVLEIRIPRIAESTGRRIAIKSS